MKYAQWISIIGGLIALLGGFLSYKKAELEGKTTNSKIDSTKETSENNLALSLKIKELTEINKQLINSNLEITNNNSVLASHNYDLTKQITQITNKTVNYITGANSYCFISLTFQDKNDDETAVLSLYNTGPNPLSDINVHIIRDNNFDQFSDLHMDMLQPNKLTTTDLKIKLDIHRKHHILYFISTNGCNLRQESYYEFKNNYWDTQTSVYDKKTDELIIQR